MSRYWRLKIEGGAFSTRPRPPTVAAICWSASVNERVGATLRAFAHPTLADRLWLGGKQTTLTVEVREVSWLRKMNFDLRSKTWTSAACWHKPD
jgi:hypothetical protein